MKFLRRLEIIITALASLWLLLALMEFVVAVFG